MRIHILGICGTFMGGLAVLARQLGHTVTGCDEQVYPPMSDTLQAAGIEIIQGYDPEQLPKELDCVVVGNALSRGNPALEYVLNKGLPYCSGPQWLAEHVLRHCHVLAVAGTHGKTTTSSILAWILQQAGIQPGYLIGGVANNFNKTAELGSGKYFVIEADEYDSAFFDKRSKFLHYRPRTLIMNNLEFDHADIFTDLEAIKAQFQILLRTVPAAGSVIYPDDEPALLDVISRGCWSSQQTIATPNADWRAQEVKSDGSEFSIWHRDQKLGRVNWNMLGQHNVRNGLAAVVAAHEVGVPIDSAIKGLNSFEGVKRRMELRGEVNSITIYDDFAHHPTAIETTLSGLRARVGQDRIVVILQFGSNTMKQGVHGDRLANSLRDADHIVLLRPDGWNIRGLHNELGQRVESFESVEGILKHCQSALRPRDHVVIMSNKGFAGIHQRLLTQLETSCQSA